MIKEIEEYVRGEENKDYEAICYGATLPGKLWNQLLVEEGIKHNPMFLEYGSYNFSVVVKERE